MIGVRPPNSFFEHFVIFCPAKEPHINMFFEKVGSGKLRTEIMDIIYFDNIKNAHYLYKIKCELFRYSVRY